MKISSKQKILILIDWFYPGYKAGGPIQSVVNLIFLLKDKYEIYILTTDTDHGESVPYDDIIANQWLYSDELKANVYYAAKSTLFRHQIRSQIEFIDPDFVYLNHLFSPLFVVYPLWLKFSGKLKSKVVICPRGALYDSALSIKAYKKKPLLFLYRISGIFGKTIFHATNERERQAIEHHFPGTSTIVADNLPDINQKEFAAISKIQGTLKCVFLSRIVPIKNLAFILDFLLQVKARVHLTVAGPVEDKDYWNLCQSKLEILPGNIKVDFAGPVAKKEINKFIRDHHLFILPTKGENFGHAIFESFSAGRPVLISDQTPWLNLTDTHSGWDIPLDDKEKFAAVLEQIAEFNQEEYDVYAKGAWQFAHDFINKSLSHNNYFKLFS